MTDPTSLPVAAPPPGISSNLADFLTNWSARSRVPFRIVFSNGAEFRAGEAEPAFTLRFRTRRAEFMPTLFGHTAMLEAYFAGELDVEGSFAMAFRAAMDAKSDLQANPFTQIRNRWHEFRSSTGSIAPAKTTA